MKIVLWRKEAKQEGDRPTYSTQFSHDYFDKKAEQWKSAKYSDRGENLRIIQLYQWAASKELDLIEANREAARAEPSPS